MRENTLHRSKRTVVTIGFIALISACAAVHRDYYYLPTVPSDSQAHSKNKTSVLLRYEHFSVKVTSFISRTMKAIGPVVGLPLPVIPQDKQISKNEQLRITFLVSVSSSGYGVDVVPEKITIHIPGQKELSPSYVVSLVKADWVRRSVENVKIHISPSKTATLYSHISLIYEVSVDDVESFSLSIQGFTENNSTVSMPLIEMKKGSVLSSELGP